MNARGQDTEKKGFPMTKQENHSQAQGATSEHVTVEVVGAGEDARSLVRVADWTLTAFTGQGDEEPRVRDLDLAERLGFERPEDIRKLISRHERAKNITPLAVFATVAETGGRPARVRYLSEPDALFIATQSETAGAVAVTKEMIRVYMLARRGLIRPVGIHESVYDSKLVRMFEQHTKLLLSVVERLSRLEAHTESDVGVVGEPWARENIRARLCRIANVAVGAPPGAKLCRPARAYLRRVENTLRSTFDFTGKGCAWKNFPREGKLVRMLLRELDALEATAIERGRRMPDPRQLSIRSALH